MGPFSNICIVVTLTCLLHAQGASNDDDQNKPYEFGFDVVVEEEKYQHRHEKKDENGLIMGEYGFLTADGVYHVTAYATDENGGFRILFTKNLRVRPLKTAKQPAKKGHSLPFPPSQNAPVTQGPSPAQSCSSCIIPQPPQQPQLTDLANVAQNQNNPQYPGQSQNYPGQQQNYDGQQQNNAGGQQSFEGEQQNYGGKHNYGGGQLNYGGEQQNYPDQQQNYDGQQQNNAGGQQSFEGEQQNYGGDQNYGGRQPNYGGEQENYGGDQQNYPDQQQNYPDQQQINPGQNQVGERNPKQFTDYPPQYSDVPTKPQLISAQMQIVDRNTDIYQRGPGEQPGLPAGLTNDDMEQLLYTFNYTVGFHGHHEEGYRNGAKKGYYYVTARDGSRTRVDYEADENGFRPKITKEVLDLLSDDVPKPETEMEERFGLRGYEFKWLYYPVN